MNRSGYKTAEFFNKTKPEYKAPVININWRETTVSSTKEPRVFGPPLWFTIHNSAAHYPINPSAICQDRIIMFIKSIPYIVPCDECFVHAQNYISQFSDNDLMDITSTRTKYFTWTVNFHNFVNERLGKKMVSVDNAYNMYHNTGKVKIMNYTD